MKKSSLLAALGILVCTAAASLAGPLLRYEFSQTGAVQQSTGSQQLDLTILNYNNQPADYITAAPVRRGGMSTDNALNFTAANVDGGLSAGNITKGAAQASLGAPGGPNSFLQNSLGSFTITAWVLNSASTNTDAVLRRLFSLRNDANQPIIELSLSTPKDASSYALSLSLTGSLGLKDITPAISVPANHDAWFFISVSYDSATGQVKFYVGEEDGTLGSATGSNTVSGSINTLLTNGSTLSIGNVAQQHQRRYDGYMSDVSFYGAALSAQEVGELHAIPEPTVSLLIGTGLLLVMHRSWKLGTR
jgi:hypothetical protein